MHGTVGWGVATRTLEYPQLQVVWFFYNDTDSELGRLTTLLKPIAEHMVDSNYWFPYPIQQRNPSGHSYRLERFADGLISSTPTRF